MKAKASESQASTRPRPIARRVALLLCTNRSRLRSDRCLNRRLSRNYSIKDQRTTIGYVTQRAMVATRDIRCLTQRYVFQSENSMISDFDRTDSRHHHQSIGYPVTSYSMGSIHGSDLSQSSASSNQNESSFDYMPPMQSSHRMRPSSSSMMGSYSHQLQHQHSQHQQYNDQSPMYANASASNSFQGDSRNGLFSPGSTQGTHFWLHRSFVLNSVGTFILTWWSFLLMQVATPPSGHATIRR